MRAIRCKGCGSDRIASVETLLGSCNIEGIDDDGAPEFSGSTDVHWDTSTTTGYECRDCGMETVELDDLVEEVPDA